MRFATGKKPAAGTSAAGQARFARLFFVMIVVLGGTRCALLTRLFHVPLFAHLWLWRRLAHHRLWSGGCLLDGSRSHVLLRLYLRTLRITGLWLIHRPLLLLLPRTRDRLRTHLVPRLLCNVWRRRRLRTLRVGSSSGLIHRSLL